MTTAPGRQPGPAGNHGGAAPDRRPVAAAQDTRMRRGRLGLFAVLAAVIVIADQVSKAWVDASFALVRGGISPVPPTSIIDGWLQIAKGYNDGAIFSLFGSSATVFAVGSLIAIAAILWYELTRGWGGPLLLTLALGLLLGGATGNLIDRVRIGHVIDFVDMGIGTWRWYTFNVADAAISTSIVLILLVSLCPERRAGEPAAPGEPGARDAARERGA